MLVCFPLFTDGVVRLNYSRNRTPLLGAGSNKGYTRETSCVGASSVVGEPLFLRGLKVL